MILPSCLDNVSPIIYTSEIFNFKVNGSFFQKVCGLFYGFFHSLFLGLVIAKPTTKLTPFLTKKILLCGCCCWVLLHKSFSPLDLSINGFTLKEKKNPHYLWAFGCLA